ncbi:MULTISPECIES: NAD(+) diphosphatase [Clostridium]|jgi:NAD+ diphosphatase|uniref:NAD(+) diphosphatase n=3 Tax=Clostridium TaxID=1485 RepID=D8GK75_CLOLD|nr:MULTISPECIES: NUDIX domain-containing protein [Clostridium]ADK13193.1 NADH pyrophosphatase [Clostridium ljungdahlii DSM 13528]AGY76418.1 NUDIX domain-containing protein [Clostridium autoethanogenum DSM 10061]ALU36581.1 NUDIX hydrolase [Clostridium autoethanogenum DSM 10061]OAA84434.1 NADH pyrophosphatase [Clostridium ljungdahlii DSM 13528]OVY48667.1 NADH pyrophosphatase [Clostridium autoethanogenum]
MKFKYCPMCGKELEEKYSWDEGGVPYCPKDDIMYFDTPRPCVIVAVIKENKILLLKQSYIFKDSKVLLSGYVTNGETVEETVHREVFEEAGLKVKDLKYLGSEYVKNNSKEIIMLTFMAKYDGGNIKKSAEVEWVNWGYIEDALCEMKEDEIGKRIVRKVLKELGYTEEKAYRCDNNNCQTDS